MDFTVLLLRTVDCTSCLVIAKVGIDRQAGTFLSPPELDLLTFLHADCSSRSRLERERNWKRLFKDGTMKPGFCLLGRQIQRTTVAGAVRCAWTRPWL